MADNNQHVENPEMHEGHSPENSQPPLPEPERSPLATDNSRDDEGQSTPDVVVTTDASQAPPPAKRPAIVRVFIGRAGLRAGWRLLIYLVLVGLLGGAIARALHFFSQGHRPAGLTAWGVVVSDTLLFTIVLVPSLIMGMFEKRNLAHYGLPLRRAFGRRFWEGALWGFAALTVLLTLIRASGDFYFGHVQLQGARVLYFAAVWGLAFIMVGLAEEYALRGYSMFTLASGIGFWPAALILSFVFAWLHRGNPGETAVGLLDVVAIALFFCLTLRVTGNLWFAIGYHAAWDWGETFFYGVPNSGMAASGHLLAPQFHGSRWITGGTAGPEGSVLSIVLTCVVAALFAMRFKKKVVSGV